MGLDHPTILIGAAVAAAAALLVRWCLRRFRAALKQMERDEHVHHD
ncbi:hypothetical protein [Burkholderia glumae]|nr:hypothetical protein [Burkholderia glumae]